MALNNSGEADLKALRDHKPFFTRKKEKANRPIAGGHIPGALFGVVVELVVLETDLGGVFEVA